MTGKGFRPRPIELGKWRPVAGVLIVLYFLLTVVAPLLVLLYTSLLRFYAPPSKDTFESTSPSTTTSSWRTPPMPLPR